MGNEAGDADSIISSLILSYVRNCLNVDSVDGSGEQEIAKVPGNTGVPIVSINREDMALRRDVIRLLSLLGIDDQNLTYIDDDSFRSIVNNRHEDSEKEESVSFTLVDHNKLRNDLYGLYQNHVVEILDHHKDEGCHIQSVLDDKRNVAFEGANALVGSSCTLIVEEIIGSASVADELVDPGVGLSLLGVILLDTLNMSTAAGKGTSRDEAAINFLMEKTNWTSLHADESIRHLIWSDEIGSEPTNDGPDREKLFRFLNDAKSDPAFWDDMTGRDALRIDYKRFTSTDGEKVFGLSSVMLSISSLLSKKDFEKQVMNYMGEANIALLGILSMTIVNGTPNREFLLIGHKTEVNALTEFFLDPNSSASFLEMSLEKNASFSDDREYNFFKQKNPKGSRKQVAPVMINYYK
jgi:inorganic pyrophosphatase/exopolyphosphatase